MIKPNTEDQSSSSGAINRDSIAAAARRIGRHIRTTPVITTQTPRGPVELKLEYLQLSGTFKARGAFNRLLAAAPASFSRVATASGGNHGVAVACAAQALGIAADIFVPEISPASKRDAIARFGATIHVGGAFYAEAFNACSAFVEQSGALLSHAYDMAQTLDGQGTVAMEWQQQTAGLDTVLVAVGGGGLIGGMAAWYEDAVKVVAVETQGCATLHSALAAERPIDIEVSGLAADSLGARRCGQLMFPIAQRYVNQSVLVTDASVKAAQTYAWDSLRIALEPGGAAALAAWLDGTYRASTSERVGILLCGANTEPPPGVTSEQKPQPTS